MNDLVKVPTIDEIKSYELIAKHASNSQYWDSMGGAEGKLCIMILARELGVSPMMALSGEFHNIQGKITVSARLMNTLIRQKGHILQTLECTDQICRIKGKRKDTGETMEVSFTIEEAKKAGLVKEKSAWIKTPSDMLFSRAISRLGRRLFPDCIGATYVHGEITGENLLEKEEEEEIEVLTSPVEEERITQPQIKELCDLLNKIEDDKLLDSILEFYNINSLALSEK